MNNSKEVENKMSKLSSDYNLLLGKDELPILQTNYKTLTINKNVINGPGIWIQQERLFYLVFNFSWVNELNAMVFSFADWYRSDIGGQRVKISNMRFKDACFILLIDDKITQILELSATRYDDVADYYTYRINKEALRLLRFAKTVKVIIVFRSPKQPKLFRNNQI